MRMGSEGELREMRNCGLRPQFFLCTVMNDAMTK